MPDAVAKASWSRVAFGDVVRQVRDTVDPLQSGLERYIAGEHMDTDDLRLRRWGAIGDGYLGPAFHMRFKAGQVLYGSRRTYLRKIVVPDFEGITANTTFVLESKNPDVLLPELLPFVMQREAFHEHSIKQSKGSVNPYINFSDVAWYEFDLPPLEEQRRIARLLNAGVRTRSRLQDLARIADALYRAAGAEQFARPGRADVDPAAWKRDGWKHQPLEALVLPSAPICYGIVQVGDDDPGGVSTLAIKDLTGDFSTSVHRTATSIESRYSRSRTEPGDVLLSIKASIGEVAIVPDGFKGNISRDLARLRFDGDRIRPRFFFHLYRTARYTQYVSSLLVGSTRAELSIAALREMAVPFPSLEEQDRLIDEMDAIMRARASVAARGSHAYRLNRDTLEASLSQPGTRQ